MRRMFHLNKWEKKVGFIVGPNAVVWLYVHLSRVDQDCSCLLPWLWLWPVVGVDSNLDIDSGVACGIELCPACGIRSFKKRGHNI